MGTASRRRTRAGLGVDVPGALNLLGALVTPLGLAFLLPAALAAGYGEAVWPFLVAGAILGSGLGGVTVADRVLMVRLSPPERLGEFFGLYGLVGKGSQVIGQLLYGAIITGGALAVTSTTDARALRVAAGVVGVLVVYWSAHVYVRVQGRRLRDSSASLRGLVAGAAAHEAGVLVGGVPALAVFGLATALGAFQGTATGSCVEAQFRTASTPAYDGRSLSTVYPFSLAAQ